MWTNARRVAAHLILFILSKLCSSLIRAQKTSGMGAQPMINYHDPRDIFEKARQALISSVALLRSLAFTRRDIIVRNSWKPSGETSRVRGIPISLLSPRVLTVTKTIGGSITRPAPSLRPASHTPLLEMHADVTTDLLAGLWSGGTRSISEPHPLGNNSEFHPALRKSLRLGLRLARTDLQ